MSLRNGARAPRFGCRSARCGRAILLLSPLLFAGCFLTDSSSPPNPDRFPIGLFSVRDSRHLQAIRDAGFDTVEVGSYEVEDHRLIARQASRLGMEIIGHPEKFLSAPLEVTDGWPIEAWYIDDEPVVNKHPVEWVERVSQQVRRWDAQRAQTFVVGQGSVARAYGHIGDAFMMDWYPVPHLPLDTVADQIDIAHQHLPRGKPLWMVVQAYDWRDEPQRRKIRIGRFPSYPEIRFMSYLSIVHNVNGLFYFTFRKPGGRNLLDDFPEQWQALVRVTREIKELQPMLEQGDEIPFPVERLDNGLEGRAWNYRGKPFAVLVNRSTAPASFPGEFLDAAWRPMFEVHRDPKRLLTKQGESWSMPAHRVMVFERRR